MKRSINLFALVLGSVLVLGMSGHGSPAVTVEHIGVRTVEHIGSMTLTTEPGKLVIYHD